MSLSISPSVSLFVSPQVRSKLEGVVESLQQCDDLRLEMAHYAEKLRSLGADPAGPAKKSSSLFGKSKVRNRDAGGGGGCYTHRTHRSFSRYVMPKWCAPARRRLGMLIFS